MKKILLITLLTVLAMSPGLRATVLFDNGPADETGTGSVFNSDTTTDTAGNTFTQAGNVFTPTTSGTATNVTFAGTYLTDELPASDAFLLTLYSAPSGTPLTLLASSTLSGVIRTNPGVGEGFTVYEFSGTLDVPFSFLTEDSYFLGITDTTSPANKFARSLTTTPGSATTDFTYSQNASAFVPVPGTYSMAFSLNETAAVPEPTTVSLCVVMLLVFVVRIYAQRRQIIPFPSEDR